MKNIKTSTLAIGLLSCALFAGQHADAAEPFPNKPIKIVVPYAPGGASDILARSVAESMAKTLGRNVFVENRAGASGTTGSEFVARSVPDGYTLVMGTSASHSLNTVVFAKTYDPSTAFTPIALVSKIPNLIFVSKALPVHNVEGLLAYLKAHPGTPVAVGGPATSGRFATELLMAKLGIKLTVVPYSGSTPAMTDVLANHVSVGVTDLLSPIPYIKTGDLRPIAVTGERRAAALKDVPTVAETAVPQFDAVAWTALFAPRGTPPDIVGILNDAVRKAFEAEPTRTRFEALGQEIDVGSPADLERFMNDDMAKWKSVASGNNLTF